MNLKKWMYLFVVTALIGSGVSIAVGIILNKLCGFQIIDNSQGINIYTLVQMFLIGTIIGSFSHLGLFSYLMVRMYSAGFFKNPKYFQFVQVVVVGITLFEIIVWGYFWRYLKGTINLTDFITEYVILPLILLILSLLVAREKAKQTNISAFVPTLVFLFTVSLLESVPAYNLINYISNGSNFSNTLFMISIFFICNTWQILQLHKLLPKRLSN